MPKEAAMTRTALLARCSAAAATATLLAGLAAAPAMARPDPGEPTTQLGISVAQQNAEDVDSGRAADIARLQGQADAYQSQVYDGSTKAQIDHNEWLLLDGRTKAQIEHEEALSSVPSTDGDVVSAPADEFPWAVASFAATGLAAVAAGGVVMLRQRRSVPQPA
jgi:hypothetical protein